MIVVVISALFFGGPLYVLFSGQVILDRSWRDADRSSAHLAPSPEQHPEAIVQIYAARTYGWRAMFAVHTWIATKAKGAKQYTVYQAVGWNLFYKKPIVDIRQDIPDRIWFDHRPQILYEAAGEAAEALIPEIKKWAAEYPYQNKYDFWPGPNSNTFTAYIIRQIPSIKIRLPVAAIGKDYLPGAFCTTALSKTGIQCSLKGLLSVTLSRVEGIEISILGAAFSVNFVRPFVHLPGID